MSNPTRNTAPARLPDEPAIYPYVAMARLPAQSALVFAPHPDDEVFGCGGLIAAWLAAGVPVHVVLVSDGAQGGDMQMREQESLAAAQALAGPQGQPARLSFWRLPDRQVQADTALVNRMRQAMIDSAADCVLAPSAYEVHPDHRAVSCAATQAFAAAFQDDSPARLVYYEVGHPLFVNQLVDITPVLALKQAAIACFPSQLQAQDYGQQVLALNRFRSYTLGPSVSHAEAFQAHTAETVRAGLAAVVAKDAAQVTWRLGLEASGNHEAAEQVQPHNSQSGTAEGFVDNQVGRVLKLPNKSSAPGAEDGTNGSLFDAERFVQALYLGFLLREPEPGAVAGWSKALAGGAAPDEVAHQFLNSAEFKQRHSPGSVAFVPPGHFYSPVVDPATVVHLFDKAAKPAGSVAAVDLNEAGQMQNWQQMLPHLQRAAFPAEKQPERRYFSNNPAYGIGDASIYFAMLCLHRPKRIIEIGSGFSSACALDTIERCFEHKVEITFVEPYPALLESLLKRSDRVSTRVLPHGVQDVGLDTFRELEAGDILFIDSTHVLKTGSDVHYEFLEILPVLQPGVLIHVHDIFWPFEYPKSWVVDENRSWNELYALRAFLMYNPTFRVEFFNDFFVRKHSAMVQHDCPAMLQNPGGGIWLRKLSWG